METANFYLDFNVTGAERKRLAKAIADFIQDDANYLGAPTFAYQVDYFTIDKKGVVSFDSRADSAEIEGLIEVLANQGFVAVDSHLGPLETIPGNEATMDTETACATEAQQVSEADVIAEVEVGEPPAETVNKTAPEDVPELPLAPSMPAEVQAQLEALRNSLIREINRKFDGILRTGGTVPARERVPVSAGSPGQLMTMPLLGDTSTLRGTKPVSVKYNDATIPATSWKKVAAVILDICNRQEQYHQALIQARDTIAGRGRKLLSASPQGMYSPLRIDEGLYMETNFSTEALLKFVKERILGMIGFDASGIVLEYRHP